MKITASLPTWLWLIVGMAAFNPAWGDDAPKNASEDLSKLSDEEILRGLGNLGIGGAHPLSQKGRFAIVFSPIMKEDTFLLDTATGRIWRQVKSLEGEWSVWAIFGASVPEYRAWEEMERIDTGVVKLDAQGNRVPTATQGQPAAATPPSSAGEGEVIQNGWRYNAKTYEPIAPVQQGQKPAATAPPAVQPQVAPNGGQYQEGETATKPAPS